MTLSARSRSVLVVAPIGAALFGYAAIGILAPHLIDPGPPLSILLVATVTAGAGTVAILLFAATRASGASRAFWASTGLTTTLATLVGIGYLLIWPGWLIWGVLRLVMLASVVIVITAVSHTLRRSPWEWTMLLLEGWLVAASVFLISWAGVSISGSPFAQAPSRGHLALYWIPVDLFLAGATAGAAMRSRRQTHGTVLLCFLAALLELVIDIVWVLIGSPNFAVGLWLIQCLTLAGAAALSRGDVWGRSNPIEDYPPWLRLPQWAAGPGLIVAVVLRSDPVMVAAAVSVVVGLACELAISGRQNQQLWQTLRAKGEHLDQLLSESRDAIVHIDARGFVRFANEAVADVLGFTPAQVLRRSGLSLVHPSDRSRVIAEITRLGDRDGRGGRISGRFRHADGGWRSVEATVTRRTGGEAGYTLSARDVSERVSLENELRRLAGTDALTSLLNRPAFLALLEGRLRESPATVLFVDLDGFKAVNDMDGHAAGDRLLREVSDTLRRELRGPDVAARLGGDEFAVLLGTDQLSEARAVADRLVHRLRRMPSDQARRTAASVGVATGKDISAETLLGDADLAMYEAKARGGRRHVVFEPWMRERVTERARMSDALERACAGEGLLLYVQPIVAMADESWVGFEALARWQDGARRREPKEFLPVAEESGLIDQIGQWIMHRSLSWLTRWPDSTSGISVNVAGSQLATAGFGDWVHRQLADFGVAPDRLTLEISERTALGDLHRATAVLQPLRALGVRIALDDFGTGYSSLGHLAELPVDELKIDRSFVIGIGRRAQDDALVRAVCRLGNDLGLRIVAEGVETLAQANILLEHGCQLAQGFRFHPPTPSTEIVPPTRNTPLASPRSTGWSATNHQSRVS